MKIAIEYDTREDAQMAINAPDAWSLLRSLEEEMRNSLKYDIGPCLPPKDDGMCYSDVAHNTAIDTTEYWRTRLYQLCEEFRIDLEL